MVAKSKDWRKKGKKKKHFNNQYATINWVLNLL